MASLTQLQKLYKDLDRLVGSGEDVVAEIRAEINNMEIEILKEDIICNAMKRLANELSQLRCTVDFSFQFDGEDSIEYSFCKSGSISLIRDKVSKENEATEDSAYSNGYSLFDDSDIQPASKQNLEIKIDKDYSPRAVAIYGDTKDLSEEFKSHGGYFNKYLRGGAGWVFSKSRLDEVLSILGSAHITYVTGAQATQKPASKSTPSQPSAPKHKETLKRNVQHKTRETRFERTPEAQKFINYLRQTGKKKGGSYSSSSISAYSSALLSHYMRSVVIRFNSSGNIFNIKDLDTLAEIMDNISADFREKKTSSVNLISVKTYIEYLNDTGQLIE